MQETINTKELRAELPKIVERVKRGERFTVLYRSKPAFRIVPVDDWEIAAGPLSADPLYRAGAVGESSDGWSAADHDELIYGSRTR